MHFRQYTVAAAAAVGADARVCGVDGVTYAHPSAAALAGVAVLNCGACGECSNEQDVGVYLATAADLTVRVRACGMRLLAKRRDRCLADLGFSPGCAACFAANIDCDRRHCLWPCLRYTLRSWFSGPPRGGQQETLGSNPCLACDERVCGPAFLACAGANRRRAGIVSDIGRSGAEVCQLAVNFVKPAERH
ncbi:hypothetical protein HXX76_009892 [Chlamydomonas incerta]|uniref:Uncharacterized protein n=1 Tax=Chlamydomonas incerta TaxID=51695 RepID=A0A835T1V2_CHLIN|nr:hypothetical protein HXX76_009892 [Chlamydomonas incerta]|eukprot:KAG2430920.1 hypothetical protein HXX76_009892 [Chlamydomonas incerta]